LIGVKIIFASCAKIINYILMKAKQQLSSKRGHLDFAEAHFPSAKFIKIAAAGNHQ